MQAAATMRGSKYFQLITKLRSEKIFKICIVCVGMKNYSLYVVWNYFSYLIQKADPSKYAKPLRNCDNEEDFGQRNECMFF